jgi:hypothetical protein
MLSEKKKKHNQIDGNANYMGLNCFFMPRTSQCFLNEFRSLSILIKKKEQWVTCHNANLNNILNITSSGALMKKLYSALQTTTPF